LRARVEKPLNDFKKFVTQEIQRGYVSSIFISTMKRNAEG